MFRSTTFAIALLCSISLGQSQNTDVCQGLLEEYTLCILNAPDNAVNGDDYYIDESACTECFLNNNFFEQYDATNCDDATTEICKFYMECLEECFPKNTICSEELSAYYTCEAAKNYAPESCMVTCEGTVGGVANGSDDSPIDSGDGEDNEVKDMDVDEQQDSTSAGSTTSAVVALSASASTLLVVAGLLL